MDESIESIVDGWVTGESGRFTVIGRCNRVPIHLNDEFEVVFRYRPPKGLDDLAREPIRVSEEPAPLRVIEIHSYGKSLRTLGQGMTGSLVVEGPGTSHIAPGCVLGRYARAMEHGQTGSGVGLPVPVTPPPSVETGRS